MKEIYDVIIIGGGIAGLTSAIYTLRGGLKTLIIEKNQLGGQIINSNNVENFPGFKSISGYSLITNIKEQVLSLNGLIVEEEVVSISQDSVTTNNNIYNTKTIIIASGLEKKKLGIEDKFVGSGVSYCATCDGNFFKDKDVCVIGGGNTALEDALYLSNIVSKVYLIHRKDKFRADDYLISKIKERSNVEIILNNELISINGDSFVESVTLKDKSTINVSGVFIAIGNIPNTKIYNDLLEIDDSGYIISDDTKTNIPNIFVAGDVRNSNLKQLITASSDGAIAAYNCINYLNS